MVQKYQSPVRIYKYPFEMVMAAYEKRFPTCKMIPVFLGSEIIHESVEEDGAVHIIERRCKLNVDAPYLIKKIVGVDYVFFIQKNILNKRERCLNIEAYNESFSTRIIVHETCQYSVHPSNSNWTCFEQNASLDVKSFFGLESTIEKLAMRQYCQNIQKGKEVIEFYIQELIHEGVITLPPYKESLNTGTPLSFCKLSDEIPKLQLNNETELIFPNGIKTDIEDPNLDRLDADYIQKYLGELTPIQEYRLLQICNWIAKMHKSKSKAKVPTTATLLRFLKAQDFNLEKSKEMLTESLFWRKKYQIDKILKEYEIPQVFKNYFPGGWHGQDKDGHPLYLLRLGQVDSKGLLRSVGEEGLLRFSLYICEEGLEMISKATDIIGHSILSWSLLIDMEGLNMRHLWRPGIRALLQIIEIVAANYPETLGRVLIVRAPRVFPILWTLVNKFIDETTRSKFVFNCNTDLQSTVGLEDYINFENIPSFLGGPCKANIPEGKQIPKSLYLSTEMLEKEQLFIFEKTVYQSISLSRGQVHEVIIQNEEVNNVICWDFDVLKNDMCYSVFYTKVPIIRDSSVPISPLQTLQNITSDFEHRSVIERHWKEGQEYIRVEPSITVKEGESIQGSHITLFIGTYILQWKIHELPHTSLSARGIFDDIIAMHRAKAMYFYEILAAADYKGSMSSLISSHSGFSNLTESSRHSAVSFPSR